MAIDGPNDAAWVYPAPDAWISEEDPNYGADVREQNKLDAYVPNPTGENLPWYERIAAYGLTRAIDANFGPPPTNKTSTGGTFAGQNGQTYSQVANRQPTAQNGMGNYLPLILAGVVALFALS